MKTKNIFKLLTFAMMMPAMLLATACSSSDDDLANNNENTNKKGYPLQVTVNVTREGDASTRANYNESSRELEFSTGDQLFVKGIDNRTDGAGRFAGTLDYESGVTFIGTIITEKKYTGSADALFTAANAANDVSATLLPAGYENVYSKYLFIDSNNSDVYYDDYVLLSDKDAFATTKKLAIEQLSLEQANTYSSGFALVPQNAILSFTITGLTASKKVDITLKKSDTDLVIGSVYTDGSGNATFAMGVKGGTHDIKDLTLIVDDNDITLTSTSKELAAGKIYNITRSK